MTYSPPFTYLFVYGTLRRGSRNKFPSLLSESTRFIGRAKVRGRLYSIADYPGAVLSESDDAWVTGEVYELRPAAATLRILDEYEGSSFKRVRAPSVLDSGACIEVEIYVYRGDLGGKCRIASGDYMLP